MGAEFQNDPVVNSFVAAALDFCGLIDRKARCSNQRFFKKVLTATVRLYSCGIALPDVKPEPGFNPGGEWFEKNKGLPIEEQLKHDPKLLERAKQRQLIRPNIARSLGGELPYRMVFEPFRDEKAISATVSDDLEDIYLDVKEGLLMLKDQKRISASTVWTWKFKLQIHWGRHAVNVMNALHSLCFG